VIIDTDVDMIRAVVRDVEIKVEIDVEVDALEVVDNATILELP